MGRSPNSEYGAIIRAKNSATTLPETIRRLKAQQLPPSKIVLVDSGSTDETIAIASKEGCEIVRYPTHLAFNYSKAINLGLPAIESPCVLVISSHVGLPSADTTRWMVSILDNFPISGVHCPLGGTGEMLPFLPPRFETIDSSNFNGMNGLSNCCALYRRADLVEFPFDESIPTAEDQKWAANCYSRRNERNATCCLHSHKVAYWNKSADIHKTIREQTIIHKYVLPPGDFNGRVFRMFLNVGPWLLRGKTRTARTNFAVARRLLGWKLATWLGRGMRNSSIQSSSEEK